MSYPLELWGGVECTVNRVGNRFIDQLELSGHARRPGDLDLFAGLGIRALRYPVLWERTAPGGLASADWSWADERLARLRELNVRPVVGLVHHGSGPRDTSLVDPGFHEKLARYARAVALRYPWVEDYTLVNQCRAVALSMRAVREINPRARLVQTEDLGKTHSTRALRYQADFENERRWLSFDLLTGRFTRAHPLWHFVLGAGVPQRELEW